MHPSRHRTARIETAHYRRDEFVAVVEDFGTLFERLFGQLGERAEIAAQYAVICLLWGMIVYLALAFALQ